MQPFEPPKANPENLLAIVRAAYEGKVVIPEFQRSFLWSREDIEELLISVLQGYFIGTFLLLDGPPATPLFPFRTVEGLDKVNPGARTQELPTVRLVLDGQQRITSLFYALYHPGIPLKWSTHAYRFYFYLERALDQDPTDAVAGVSLADRRRIAEAERLLAEGKAVTFSHLADPGRFFPWLYSKQEFVADPNDRATIEAFHHRFANFLIPVVALSPETGRANIVNIFERINRTGVSLSLFDLAVARLYLKGVKLRHLWDEFAQNNVAAKDLVRPEHLLKMIALLEGREVRKSTLLDAIDAVGRDEFTARWAAGTGYVNKACQRITSPHGYGAMHPLTHRLVPYTTLVVPLAALLYEVERRCGGAGMYHKVDRWYWASVFSQRYDHAVDSQTYGDVKEVAAWLEGGAGPAWIARFDPEIIDFAATESRSAVYRGLMCLIARAGARDWATGNPADLHECDDDHIFPRAKFGRLEGANSILNRSLLSRKTNHIKGDKKPSEYLPWFLKEHECDEACLRETLATHLITPAALEAMRGDDFEAFIKARRTAFVQAVGEALA